MVRGQTILEDDESDQIEDKDHEDHDKDEDSGHEDNNDDHQNANNSSRFEPSIPPPTAVLELELEPQRELEPDPHLLTRLREFATRQGMPVDMSS